MSYEPQTLIDRITYTASLATHAADIDPYLDAVREITSQPEFVPGYMTPAELQTLTNVQQRLEAYLVEKELQRSFTPQSLQAQIKQHLAGNVDTTQTLLKALMLWCIAAAAALAVVLLPILPHDHLEHIVFGGAVATAVMDVGAAWLFVKALPGFSSTFRHAFTLLCEGMILFGMALLLEPYAALWNLHHNLNLSTFVIMPIVVTAVVLMYGGAVRYAVLAGVRSWLFSWKLLLGVAGSLVILALLIPVLSSWSVSKLTIETSALLHGLLLVFGAGTATALHKSTRAVADLYRPPLRALLQAIVSLTIAAAALVGITTSAGAHLTTGASVALCALLFAIGTLLLRAGYSFSKISHY